MMACLTKLLLEELLLVLLEWMLKAVDKWELGKELGRLTGGDLWRVRLHFGSLRVTGWWLWLSEVIGMPFRDPNLLICYGNKQVS